MDKKNIKNTNRISFSEIEFSQHFAERLCDRFNFRIEQILDQASYFKVGTPDSKYRSIRSKVGKNHGFKYFFHERLNLIISVDERNRVATTAMYLNDEAWSSQLA